MSENNHYSGKKLAAILEAQGRRRRWLAAQVGVTERMLNYVIAGERTFQPELAERAATALGIPVFLLVDEFHIRNEIVSLSEGVTAA